MKYSDAKNLVPSATYLYVGVSQEDIDLVEGHKYISEFEGEKILGTMEPVEFLIELAEGSLSF